LFAFIIAKFSKTSVLTVATLAKKEDNDKDGIGLDDEQPPPPNMLTVILLLSFPVTMPSSTPTCVADAFIMDF